MGYSRMVKQLILDNISDLVADLLYYDRKSDEDLPLGTVEKFIKNGEISTAEMAEYFRTCLEEKIKGV
jgi:hypothetical protein